MGRPTPVTWRPLKMALVRLAPSRLRYVSRDQIIRGFAMSLKLVPLPLFSCRPFGLRQQPAAA
jgi:hypothetical protein